MADKDQKAVSAAPEKEPAPVLIVAEQPPIPVTIVAADGVTPVPIPALGIEANTPPEGTAPAPAATGTQAPLQAATGTPQATTTTTTTTAPQPAMVAKSEELTLAPTTTAAADKVTEGQRHINRLWEYTQATIAVMVVAVTLFVLSVLALRTVEISVNAVLIAGQIVVMATYIVNTYFQRTNHVLQGGVGPKTYEGR